MGIPTYGTSLFTASSHSLKLQPNCRKDLQISLINVLLTVEHRKHIKWLNWENVTLGNKAILNMLQNIRQAYIYHCVTVIFINIW